MIKLLCLHAKYHLCYLMMLVKNQAFMYAINEPGRASILYRWPIIIIIANVTHTVMQTCICTSAVCQKYQTGDSLCLLQNHSLHCSWLVFVFLR